MRGSGEGVKGASSLLTSGEIQVTMNAFFLKKGVVGWGWEDRIAFLESPEVIPGPKRYIVCRMFSHNDRVVVYIFFKRVMKSYVHKT